MSVFASPATSTAKTNKETGAMLKNLHKKRALWVLIAALVLAALSFALNHAFAAEPYSVSLHSPASFPVDI